MLRRMTERANDHAHDDARYDTTVRWIEYVCLGFAALGIVLPVAYGTPFFAIYRDGLVAHCGDVALGTSSPTLQLCLGITGGSIAGKWIAHYAVARLGLRTRRRWAREATLAGLLTWLLLDSGVSLASGAWLNVVVINPMPPLLLLPLLGRIWPSCDREDVVAPMRAATRVALGAMGFGAISGLVVALAGDGAPFAAWREALAVAHFGGAPLPEAARAIVRWFLGPIGGATLGQFVLLAFLVRHEATEGGGAALSWALGSLLLWFVTDGAWSLASGARFNVTMVDLPALVVTALPLAWARVARPRASRPERGSPGSREPARRA